MEKINVQPYVDVIEKNVQYLKALNNFNAILVDFISLPRSKKEVCTFLYSYVINKLADEKTLNALIAKLSPEPSINNINVFKTLLNDAIPQMALTMLGNVKDNLTETVKKVFGLIMVIYMRIEESHIDNKQDRMEGVLRNIYRMTHIFETTLPNVLDKTELTQITPAYPTIFKEDSKESLTQVKQYLDELIDKFDKLEYWTFLSTCENHALKTSPLLGVNNWLTLRNIVVCLNCYTE